MTLPFGNVVMFHITRHTALSRRNMQLKSLGSLTLPFIDGSKRENRAHCRGRGAAASARGFLRTYLLQQGGAPQLAPAHAAGCRLWPCGCTGCASSGALRVVAAMLFAPLLPAGIEPLLPAVPPQLPSGPSGCCCGGWDGTAPAATARRDVEPKDWELVAARPGVEACSRSTISAASGRCAT